MTIRRRYYLSLVTVLALFGANLFAYFWSARVRSFSESEWDKATTCELKISSIREELDNLNKHVVLASQIQQEDRSSAGGVETTNFEKTIATTELDIRGLREAAAPDQLPALRSFIESYRDLTNAWMSFYSNAGKDEAAAVRNQIQADLLVQKVFGEQLPKLESLEAARIHTAQVQFQRAELLANRVIIATFLLSVLIAFALSFAVSRHLHVGFSTLKRGVRYIGDMELEHRITYPSKDEFAELAESFNEMAGKLSSARHELLQTNQQLSESETRYRNLVDRAVYGIFRCTDRKSVV